MMDIERRQTELNPQKITKKSFHGVRTLNTEKRARDLKKINDQNKGMLKRLQSANSAYSINNWIDHDRKHAVMSRNISQNARRNLHSDFSATSRNTTFYRPQSGLSRGYQSGIQSGMHYEYEN